MRNDKAGDTSRSKFCIFVSNYSSNIENIHVSWIKRFSIFHERLQTTDRVYVRNLLKPALHRQPYRWTTASG